MLTGLNAVNAAQPTDVSREADPNSVYLTWVDLDQSEAAIAEARPHLSLDECERADRYHRLVHRNRFMIARSNLRRTLGSFLQVPAEEIAFVSGPNGKPALNRQFPDLRFNLAHSESMAVIAVAFGRDVGVDVEYIRPNVQFLEIAQRMFTPGECAQIQALTGDEIMHAFYRCWTRKEAYVKATGAGLTVALDSFEVPVTAESAPLPVALHDSGLPTATLTDISPNNEFAAALAVLGPNEPVQLLIQS
ncbi:MAG: 4'-phosphopantetheinyl transferase family protein [Chthoniobacterales bacterium]